MNDRSETRVSFDGFIGGAAYDLLARITGYVPAYYRGGAKARLNIACTNLPEEILTTMINETFRILRSVEWSRPRFGYSSFVWSLFLQRPKDSDNWQGTYPNHFSKVGFELISDRYVDSLNRCQIFIKPKVPR
ncbi:MAG: hypothetical protein RQ801_00980 [Spirochaetaceae bacterium]|nr:hypothetical protein [Spirochaetaceae bacterium]MDT8296844.1 hypothetical protein [Spirochaetaceae bacterium]